MDRALASTSYLKDLIQKNHIRVLCVDDLDPWTRIEELVLASGPPLVLFFRRSTTESFAKLWRNAKVLASFFVEEDLGDESASLARFAQHVEKNFLRLDEFLQTQAQRSLEFEEDKRKFHQFHDEMAEIQTGLKDERRKLRRVKAHESSQIDRFREQVRFVLNLSQCQHQEETLKTLLESFKPHFQPLSVFWCRPLFGKLVMSIYEKNELKNFELPLSSAQDLGTKVPWSIQLAKALSRPCLPVLSVSIAEQNEFFGLEGDFSSELDPKSFQSLQQRFQEKIYPLSLTLERVQNSDALHRESLIWEKTFNSLQEPVAIFQSDGELLRGNSVFNAIFSKGRSSEDCAGMDEFEKNSYPIPHTMEGSGGLRVEFYKSVKESRSLEAQWVQSKKIAALGAVAGNLSHELSNPLAGLKSLAQFWIQELPKDSSWVADLVEMEQACIRSQEIILELMRFTSSDQTLEPVQLDEVVKKTLLLLKSHTRSLRLDVQLESSPHVVRANRTLLSQVIYNLVVNATQAMEQKGLLRIHTFKRVNGEGRFFVRFEIQDSGPGIPGNLQKKIFDPFFTTKPSGQGAGLGLSLSQKIIRSFSGDIGVLSDPGFGAKFWFEIPLSDSEAYGL